ncbi:hypothetical protein RclHR1_17970002 [Rhizophagus clarus]|uniref:Kinase-like domain-containing protein n=1 Tax=Rhizophagus clarus TaxID=94130 RepID=A0A2Z6QL01_9GLOM|nr:hypothetical protein RclHR1_17970002 [Rhizophagus clarus]GET03062.1 kinase-like domain-containing protein [Rhizophagus clarus]
MANNLNINTEADESIQWIENGIKNRYINYHDYSEFQNQELVGKGAFGNVHKTSWKGSNTIVALKSFKGTCIMKEIVNELQLLLEVHFHANIIKFFGITKRKNNEDNIDPDYLFILEYADSGTLRNYLKENFNNLDMNTKLQFAIQISDAVSCLHEKNIIHRDLHSKNILVHQNKVKLADFGLSRRLAEVSNSVKGVIGMLPYIDPLLFKEQKDSKDQTNNEQNYKANKKSDVYSVGVLLWEISSGRLPFQSYYSHTLIIELQNGKRETPAPGMPDKYVDIYTSCWQSNPDGRPDIHQVFSDLKSLENKKEAIKYNNCDDNICSWSCNLTKSLQIGNTMEIDVNSINLDYYKNLINKIFLLYEKFLHGGIEKNDFKKLSEKYISPNNEHEKEILNYFLNNMDNQQNIILLGDFFRHGIGIKKDEKKAFELYKVAAEKGNIKSIYQLGECYFYGTGTGKNVFEAFKLYESAAEKGDINAINDLAYCYQHGIGIIKDEIKAFKLYKEAAEKGDLTSMNNLGECYQRGIGTVKDEIKAFKLYEELTEKGHTCSIYDLGYCYQHGIGTEKDETKALKLYKNYDDKLIFKK